jgi:hypothetical protein
VGHFHGDDQRQGFAIGLHLTFFPLPHEADEVDVSFERFRRNGGEAAKVLLDGRAIEPVLEQLAAAAEVRDVVAAERERGVRQLFSKLVTVHGQSLSLYYYRTTTGLGDE